VFKVVRSARAQGISVLLVEQNVRAAVEIADRAYVLDEGHIVFEGSAAEFGSERVRALAGASAEEWNSVEMISALSPAETISVFGKGDSFSKKYQE
jgi:branched-chain amino acid transport system ATP-binding protein